MVQLYRVGAFSSRFGHISRLNSRLRGVLLHLSSSSSGNKHKVVFLGTPDVAATSLNMIVDASKRPPLSNLFEIVAVVSQPPAPSGRKKKLTPSPVQVAAEGMEIAMTSRQKGQPHGCSEDWRELQVCRQDCLSDDHC